MAFNVHKTYLQSKAEMFLRETQSSGGYILGLNLS